MKLDISRLSLKKRKLLDENPEFLLGLDSRLNVETHSLITRPRRKQKKKLEEAMDAVEEARKDAELARQEAEDLKREHNVAYREIKENLRRKDNYQGLICPVCGGRNMGNTLNGKPYCFNYDKHRAKGIKGAIPLLNPKKAKKWTAPKKQKTVKYSWELEDVVKIG